MNKEEQSGHPKGGSFSDLSTEKQLAALDRAYHKGIISAWELVLKTLQVKGKITQQEVDEGCQLIAEYVELNYNLKD